MFHTCERCGRQTPDYLPECDCKPVKRSVALKPKRPAKKTVLVLPHDDRIKKDYAGAYSFEAQDGSQVMYYRESFPLICIGLWMVLHAKNQKLNGVYPTYTLPWHDLANGNINLSECRFRQLTKREQKELGL